MALLAAAAPAMALDGSCTRGPDEVAEVVVNNAAGHLCTVCVSRSSSIHVLKEGVEALTGIPWRQQRIFSGLGEISDETAIAGLACLELTLVRRWPEQAEWLRLAEEDWAELLEQPSAAWEDRQVVLAAVRRGGWALQYASEELCADREVVMSAVKQNGLSLQFACHELAADPDVVLAAIAQCGRALQFAADELKNDLSFVLSAVQVNGHALKYVSPDFQKNPEVNQKAVEQIGQASTALDGITRGSAHLSERRIKSVLQDKSVLGNERPAHDTEVERKRPRASGKPGCTYFFGSGRSQGHSGLKRALGPLGVQLCELANLGLPVAPGFCISRAELQEAEPAAKEALFEVEQATGCVYGDANSPLLLSVRCGKGEVANLGLNDIITGAIAERDNPRFALDSYRRLITAYARVVKQLDMGPFERELVEIKNKLNARDWFGREHEDWQIPTSDLRNLVETYKSIYKEQAGEEFPQDLQTQLLEVIRTLHNPSGEERVIVQAMKFGNYDLKSAVGQIVVNDTDGIARELRGDWLMNAQREDLPTTTTAPGCRKRQSQKLTLEESRAWAGSCGMDELTRVAEMPSLEEAMLPVCAGLAHCKDVLALSPHFGQSDVQCTVDFCVQQGRLWLIGANTVEKEKEKEQEEDGSGPMEFNIDSLETGQDAFDDQEVFNFMEDDGSREQCEASKGDLTPDSVHGSDTEPEALILYKVPEIAAQRQILHRGGLGDALRASMTFAWPALSNAYRKGFLRDRDLSLAAERSDATETARQQRRKLALPLWQTALAGGSACVAHRAVAASIEQLQAAGRPRSALCFGGLASRLLLRQLAVHCSHGLPFGALCCTFYVNLLQHCSDGKADSLGCLPRLACAVTAAAGANVLAYPILAARELKASERLLSQGISSQAELMLAGGSLRLFRGLPRMLTASVPTAALELCAIDVIRNAGSNDIREQRSPLPWLFASGAAAGVFSQSFMQGCRQLQLAATGGGRGHA
eukprot:TRINITY_DN30649_c0_g1_i1.p1 TRINITY_DN30649_c0_g1~~TRINITY_DN30649_c0_g1_i1.p1  ORF type:complete len:987 (+),score=235.41 TRINITY_DN30649_c0_g1_i1:32-2992(+)